MARFQIPITQSTFINKYQSLNCSMINVNNYEEHSLAKKKKKLNFLKVEI